jgi:hypothetical protein
VTAGVPVWDSGLARPTAHEPGWAATPRHADHCRGCDGDQVLGGRDPAPGSRDRAFRTASTQIRRTDPAMLRYPAGRFAVLGVRGPGGGSGVVGCEVVTAVSSRSSSFRDWTTSIIVLTANPMMPGRTAPDRGTGHKPVGSRPCVRSPIIGRRADRRYCAQYALGMAMADLPSGTVTFLFTDSAGSTAL